MSTTTSLDADEEGKDFNITKYRGMIGSLLYLTASRLDIQFSVGMCERFQSAPKESHAEHVKRIFRYLADTDIGFVVSQRSTRALGNIFRLRPRWLQN